MATQERQYYILRGTVQRQKLDEDVDRIVAALQRPRLHPGAGGVGRRHRSDEERARGQSASSWWRGRSSCVGGIDVTGNSVLPVEEITPPHPALHRRRLLAREAARQHQGHPGPVRRHRAGSADVNPRDRAGQREPRINITFEISEGPEVFVERINITGNTRSQEKILRREIPMHEGDLFTSAKLARARQRLNNLGYFETVKATTSPGPTKDKIIVNIEVTEKPTGLFSIGGGYSSADSFIGTVDLSQRNFLGPRLGGVPPRPRGRARPSRARSASPSPGSSTGRCPPASICSTTAAIFDDYTVNSLGGDIRFGHPLGDYSRAGISIYRLSQDDISDVPTTTPAPASRARKGTRITSLVGGAVTRDTRDSVFEPTRGSIVSIGADFAGIGFGDSKFVRGLANVATFHPTRGSDHVIGGRAQRRLRGRLVQRSGAPVRAVLSGRRQLHPQLQGASGLAGRTRAGTRIGGNIQLLGNIEYTVPLFFGIRAAVFYDVGSVYGPGHVVRHHVRPQRAAARIRARPAVGLAVRAAAGRLRREARPEERRASGSSSSRWAPRSKTSA